MITDKDEPIKKEAIELAEDFTDWMGASWPMCGGINATAKLATMVNKRLRLAEKMAKIAVLESVLSLSGNEYPFVDVQVMIDDIKDEKNGF